MARIIIVCSDIENAADHCRYVAEDIENDYLHGTVGWSADQWYIEE